MNNSGEILSEILRGFKDCYFFLHNTKELSTVHKIMKEGLIFENQLLDSADRINPFEPIQITYFMIERKEYGNFTIIIAVPSIIFDNYSEVSNQFNKGIEEVMTITDPYLGKNDELVYTISPKHVLGYFDKVNSEFKKNPCWDPSFNNLTDRNHSVRL